MAGSQGSAKRSTRARRATRSEEDSPEPAGLTPRRRVEIEVVEESHIPSTLDLMALYELDLDHDGELIAYRRTRRYIRGRADSTNGGAT
jgi:Gas vesicle synthesis protein GvpO